LSYLSWQGKDKLITFLLHSIAFTHSASVVFVQQSTTFIIFLKASNFNFTSGITLLNYHSSLALIGARKSCTNLTMSMIHPIQSLFTAQPCNRKCSSHMIFSKFGLLLYSNGFPSSKLLHLSRPTRACKMTLFIMSFFIFSHIDIRCVDGIVVKLRCQLYLM
jgi:hypothetical protein